MTTGSLKTMQVMAQTLDLADGRSVSVYLDADEHKVYQVDHEAGIYREGDARATEKYSEWKALEQ